MNYIFISIIILLSAISLRYYLKYKQMKEFWISSLKVNVKKASIIWEMNQEKERAEQELKSSLLEDNNIYLN